MTKPSFKRPSPALVIAILALFVALGGSAYAAGKIGTKNIKANAITTSKIKKNAITTTKIKNEAVTGAKIKESSLGPVPSATNATNATNAVHAISATNATNAVNATNFSRYGTGGVVKASVGQTVTLGTLPAPFTAIGKCVDNGGDNYEAETYLKTSAPKSFMWSEEGDDYVEGEFEPDTDASIGYGASGTGTEWQGYNGYYTDWSAASPNGSVLLQGFANSGVHVFGADCAFNVWWLNNA